MATMMFTTHPASGHLRPLVPIAAVAQSRGHEVVVAAPANMAREIAGYGLTHCEAGYDWRRDAVRHLGVDPAELAELDFAAAAEAHRVIGAPLTEDFAGYIARATCEQLLERADDIRPDVIIRELDEHGGYLAAEALGIPHVSVASFGGLKALTGPTLGPHLARGRAELGLPSDPEGDSIYRYLHANFLPAEYSPGEMILPNTRCYRHASSEQRYGRLPAWLADLDHRKPFVFVGFGTVVYDLPGAVPFLQGVIDALGRVDCEAVVAVGSGGSTQAYRTPDNVALVNFVDQPLMLEGADLFVTHGGLNSMKEALRLGVPMVCLPVLDDHRHNGAQCAANGTALVVPLTEFGIELFARSCETVLRDPTFRRSARALQRRIHALPAVEQMVDDVESLLGVRAFEETGVPR